MLWIRSSLATTSRRSVFGAPVEDMFRTRIADAIAGRDIAVVVGPCEDEEASGGIDPVINEPFREQGSCPVPLLLLEALPPVPGGIEYRVVGPDLVLWDVHADIVIDVLTEAFRMPSHV
jgi:hypothetical protein